MALGKDLCGRGSENEVVFHDCREFRGDRGGSDLHPRVLEVLGASNGLAHWLREVELVGLAKETQNHSLGVRVRGEFEVFVEGQEEVVEGGEFQAIGSELEFHFNCLSVADEFERVGSHSQGAFVIFLRPQCKEQIYRQENFHYLNSSLPGFLSGASIN